MYQRGRIARVETQCSEVSFTTHSVAAFLFASDPRACFSKLAFHSAFLCLLGEAAEAYCLLALEFFLSNSEKKIGFVFLLLFLNSFIHEPKEGVPEKGSWFPCIKAL